MEPPELGRQEDTENDAVSARRDEDDTANTCLQKQASTQSPDDKSTIGPPPPRAIPGTGPDRVTPGFLQAFSDALDIAAIADSVLQRASEARYRSLVIDSLAREAHEHSKAVTDIAHDVCRAAVAASLVALETNSAASMEDAYATYVDVKQPPINLEQCQRVMHFAQSHKERHQVRHQMPPQMNSKYPKTSTKPHANSQSQGRKSRRETRSAPSQHVSRSRSRSPETFHEKFPSTVVQCMEEFVQKCSSCSSLPSLPEDNEIDDDSSLDQEESGSDVMSSCSSVGSSPHVSPREDKSSNIYQDLCGKLGLLPRHSPPLPQLRKVSDCELVEETTRTKMSRMLETSSRSRSPTAGSDRGKAGSRPCSPLAVGSCDSGSKVDIQVLGNNTQLFQPQISRSPTGATASSRNNQQHDRPQTATDDFET